MHISKAPMARILVQICLQHRGRQMTKIRAITSRHKLRSLPIKLKVYQAFRAVAPGPG